MNQERVKEILLEIEETELEFSVIFSGKASKKVNGLYKPDIHEIILHNKNFANDNELIYTAVHEYTHHKRCEEDGGFHSSKAHSPRFWSLFHRLLSVAEEKGFYKITIEDSPELMELTERIRGAVMVQNGELMKELGALLSKARVLCKKAGVRFEDYIDRVLCLPRASAGAIERMYAYDVEPSIGYEAMKTVAKISNPQKRAEAENLYLAKNSPAAVRDKLKKDDGVKEDPRRILEKEKRRLEKTISGLQERLRQVEEKLADTPVAVFVFFAFLLLPFCLQNKAAAENSVHGTEPLKVFEFVLIAENTSSDISIPQIPAIPSIDSVRAVPGFPAIPAKPTPFNFGNSYFFFGNKKRNLGGEKNTSKLDAKSLSSPEMQKTIPLLLSRFAGGADFSNAAGGNALHQLLENLNSLNEKTQNFKQAEKTEKNGKEIKDKTNYEKKAERTSEKLSENNYGKNAKTVLKRFRINGKDLKPYFKNTVLSRSGEDKSFFFSADREIGLNGKNNTETIYFLCRKNAQGLYEFFPDLRQDKEEPSSFLYRLVEAGSLICETAGNVIFCRKKTDFIDIEIIFELE